MRTLEFIGPCTIIEAQDMFKPGILLATPQEIFEQLDRDYATNLEMKSIHALQSAGIWTGKSLVKKGKRVYLGSSFIPSYESVVHCSPEQTGCQNIQALKNNKLLASLFNQEGSEALQRLAKHFRTIEDCPLYVYDSPGYADKNKDWFLFAESSIPPAPVFVHTNCQNSVLYVDALHGDYLDMLEGNGHRAFLAVRKK